MVAIFLDKVNSDMGSKSFRSFKPGRGSTPTQTFCSAIRELWQGVPLAQRFTMDGKTEDPIQFIMSVYPGNDKNADEFVLLESGVNTAKEGVSNVFALLLFCSFPFRQEVQ